MKKQTVLGLCMGLAVGAVTAAAGTFAVRKIANEIKTDLNECCFTSPNGDNIVSITYGSSKFAKGLTFIKVQGIEETGSEDCKLVMFVKNNLELFSGEWQDNEHFRLLVGNGNRKQCCDVSFDGEQIVAKYYVLRIEEEQEAVEATEENA